MNAILALGMAALLVGLAGATVHTVILPDQACNAGTQQAHDSIPPTLPNGNVTPGHFHVPEMENGNCTTPHS